MRHILFNFAGSDLVFKSNSTKLLEELRQHYMPFRSDGQNKSNKTLEVTVISDERRSAEFIGNEKMIIRCRSVGNHLLWFNDQLRRFFCTNFTLRGGLAIHGSSVVIDGQAFIFMGEEGAGKSTKLAQLDKFNQLGDDLALVSVKNNIASVWGSPFYQKTRRTYPNICMQNPIFCFLKQSKINQLVSTVNTFVPLVRNSFAYDRASAVAVAKTALSLSSKQLFFDYYNTLAHPPELMLKSLVKLRKVPNSKILANLNLKVLGYKRAKVTARGIMLTSELGKMQLINEISWQFEIGDHHTVESCAKLLRTEREVITSPHRQIIAKYLNLKKSSFTSLRPLILLQEKAAVSHILDGNHRAVAEYQKHHSNNTNFPIPFVEVEICPHET